MIFNEEPKVRFLAKMAEDFGFKLIDSKIRIKRKRSGDKIKND